MRFGGNSISTPPESATKPTARRICGSNLRRSFNSSWRRPALRPLRVGAFFSTSTRACRLHSCPAPSLLDSPEQIHGADECDQDPGEKRDQIRGVEFHPGAVEVHQSERPAEM